MAKIIFKVLFNIMKTLAQGLLLPINAIVANAFPSFSELISTFNYVLNNYLGRGLSYFFNILPVHTRHLILLYLTILITYYTISFTVHAILKVFTILKNIKVW